MKRWLLAAFILFLASAAPASAESTGNDILEKCQIAVRLFDNGGGPSGEHFDGGWCFGWVAGALQLTKLHNEWASTVKDKPGLLQFCLPDPGIPAIQAARVVVKYLKEHPEQLHQDGMGLTVAALRESFPCK
ncbi:MAG: Rap1a/Tai family immunity protein [Candidatus Sulfotelmatobacter sp.]